MSDASMRQRNEAGAKDNGGPGVRAGYHDAYYAAFVLSPEGTTSRPSVSKTNPEPPG
jgi:hypothetical protein